jgi:amino acid transporter
MPGTSPQGGGPRRSLSVWQAIGPSIALIAPSMAANINPQASAATAGRAVPLAFLIAAIGVLLVAYTFVRLCQYYHHSGSVYAFVGATLGPRAGGVAGWGLLGTYTFYAVVTSTAAGIFGTAFLKVAMWQVVVPLLALVVLGYTLYRNVIPYPPSGPGRWFPVVSGGWLVVALVAVIVAPGFARRLGAALTASEGIGAPGPSTASASTQLPAGDASGDHAPRA